jgi:hypothetical protein
MWARAQINVAPARPNDNSVLVIASGKCSNFTEFQPFAVRLDFDTMLYSRDDDFDMEQWRDSLTVQNRPRGQADAGHGTNHAARSR